ncbi:VWA domain-containing protein [Roseibium sp. SCPC15]|uniref:vWA domain-containing protein n=1 Tax=Roseibium sp. SCP15 TaxID=3141376 RepID=UPI00333B2C27
MIFRLATLITPLLLLGAAKAQEAGVEQKSQVMMILDGSNSMWGRVDGEPKISIAKDLMTDLITNWDDSTDMGLMVYGHRRKGDCADIEVVAMPGRVNRPYLIDKVQSISPRGKTPITESLLLAAVSVQYFQGRNSVVLVSDGIETCEADPCEQARSLEELNPDFSVHVIGFDVTEEEFKSLQCIATETGGKFFRANNANELKDALKETVHAVNSTPPAPEPVPVAQPAKPEPSLLLYAKLCETCESENHDIRWTVRDGDTVLHDQLGVIYSDEKQLPPGTYDVKVQYHSSPLVREGQVTIGEDGQQVGAFDLNGGSAQLYAFATEDRNVAANPIFYRFYPIIDGQPQTNAIADSAISNEDTWLPAGRYLVTADHENLKGKAEIEIRPGETTNYTFDLRFGSIRPQVSLYEGGKVVRGRMSYGIFETEAAAQKATGTNGALASKLGELNEYMSVQPGDYFLKIAYDNGLGAVSKIVPITVAAGDKSDPAISMDVAPFKYAITTNSGFSGFGLELHKAGDDGKSAGKLDFEINAKGLGVVPPGMYFFRISNKGEVIVTKPFELTTGHTSELNITIP